jgi:magnesium-transporting ATPase (P-type)
VEALFFLVLFINIILNQSQEQSCPCRYSHRRSIFGFAFQSFSSHRRKVGCRSFFLGLALFFLFLSSTSYMVPGTVKSTSDNAMETRNLALNSTIVVQGTCAGVVFATGNKTIMGRIVTQDSSSQPCKGSLVLHKDY